MKNFFIFTILILITTTMSCKKNENLQTSSDQRQIIFLSLEEKNYLLREMRTLLKAIHNTHIGLLEGKYDIAYEYAKKSGNEMMEEMKSHKEMMQKFPMEFKKLGFAIHEKFEILAESLHKKDEKEIKKNLVEVTSTCIACHEMYKIEVSK